MTGGMMRNFILAAMLTLAPCLPALAQETRIQPWSPVGKTVTLAVTTSSSTVALGWVDSGNSPPSAVIVCNAGPSTAAVRLGKSTAVALTTDFQVSSGTCPALNMNGATHLAAITASSTAALTISVGDGSTTPGAGAAAAGGGTISGTVTANQGTAGAQAWPVKVDQTTPGTTNGVALVGVNAATALAGNGATGTGSARVTLSNDNTAIASWGQGATGATAPTGAVLNGGRGQNAEATAVTNGQMVALAADLVGKLITSPYANKENWIAGTGNATSTGATTIIASAGGSLKNYITSVQCGRTDTGTTAIIVTFNDAASTVITLPNGGNGGATNITFPTPLSTAAATAFQFTAGTGVTTLYCSAQGFKGT